MEPQVDLADVSVGIRSARHGRDLEDAKDAHSRRERSDQRSASTRPLVQDPVADRVEIGLRPRESPQPHKAEQRQLRQQPRPRRIGGPNTQTEHQRVEPAANPYDERPDAGRDREDGGQANPKKPA